MKWITVCFAGEKFNGKNRRIALLKTRNLIEVINNK